MIGLPAGTRIWIAAGVTDLRRGFTGLSGMVQTALKQNPFSGYVFLFRGRRGDLIKMLWWDGDGLQSGEALVANNDSRIRPPMVSLNRRMWTRMYTCTVVWQRRTDDRPPLYS
jgi:transposase